jgi:PKD repeat protein
MLNESNFTYTNTNYTYNFTDQSTTATSWYWNFGDLVTSTQQNPVHTYAGNGTYVVMHVVSDGQCSDTTYQANVVVDVGVTELSGTSMMIYPNPANAELRIKNSESRIDAVNIYDMVGQKVLSQPQASNYKPETIIDVSALAPGVYSIEVIAGANKGSGRFVKR